MAKTTKYGVCYDIQNSPYRVNLDGVDYFFTTAAHRNKFTHNLRNRMEWLMDSLSRRFRVSCPNMGDLAAFQLYTMCEPNAFYVEINGEGFSCPDGLLFDGRRIRPNGCEKPSAPTTAQ